MIPRAFIYGDLLFETIAVRNGNIFNLPLHVKRISLGLALFQFDGRINEMELQPQILEALKGKKDARVRLVIYREAQGFYLPDANGFKMEIDVFDLPDPKFEITQIGVYSENRKSCNPISQVKNGNAALSVLASLYGKKHDLDDVVLINEHRRVCECIASNIFIVKNDLIITPSLREGCVMGIMRERVIEAALASGLRIEERGIEVLELNAADELFLTNAIHPLVSVKQFNGRLLGSDYAGKIRSNIDV